jgi:hypothetical protein
LHAAWLPEAGGRRVRVWLDQDEGPGAPEHRTGVMGVDLGDERELHWQFGPPEQVIVVTFSLVLGADYRQLALRAIVPMETDEYVDREIGHWRVDADTPADEAEHPIETDIGPLAGAVDLFPFVWMRPPDLAEQADARLRYTRYQRVRDLGVQDLYDKLSQSAGPDSGPAKQADAAAFRQRSGLFIGELTDLPHPIDGFGQVRTRLLAIENHCTLQTLNELAVLLLAQTPAEFLASTTQAQEQVWQSLFALALVGEAADGALAAGLVDVLRVLGYLAHLAQNDPALEDEATRRLVLSATPSVPDAVAAYTLRGQAGGCSWRLLGVGQVEQARQQPLGYALGELAEVLNLMPRERQERHEHHGHMLDQQQSIEHVQLQLAQRHQQADAINELADALRAAFHSEGVVNNLSGITPSYSNLNLMLGGTAAVGGGALDWNGTQAARLVQRTSERVASQVSDQGRQQRDEVWREWREHRASRCFDNRDGERLVGVYRWVDRLVQVNLHPKGRRLVLAFEIPTPARAWLTQVAAAGPVPLVAPQPLAAFQVPNGQGCWQILPSNYQALGAQFGLVDLPAPPADTLRLSVQVQRATFADDSLLCVPPGYQVAGGCATLMLADTSYGLAASVGGVALQAPPLHAPAALSLVVPAASSSTSVGNPTATPVAPGSVWMGTTDIGQTTGSDALIGQSGPISLTVISAAPVFALSVSLVCQRSTVATGSGTPVDPLLQAWQMRVYDLLLRAWQLAVKDYETELARRIAAAVQGARELIQRQALQAECLAALAQASATSDTVFLTGCMDWAAMSWTYEDWAAAIGGPLPTSQGAPVGTVEPASVKLFHRFLHAASARVLVPLCPMQQTTLLFALQWQSTWPGPPSPRPDAAADVPVSDSVVALLEEQRHAAPVPRRRPWTLRLPLPQIYLQEGDALPFADAVVAPGQAGEVPP